MSTNGLFLFVEGADDERLIYHLCSAHLQESYAWIKTYQYAQKKSDKVCDFLRAISSMGSDYIFFADADLDPSVSSRKQKVMKVFSNIDEDKLQIVVQEIESWYLAGLDDEACEEIGISKKIRDTEKISKEQFRQFIPSRFDSYIDFMIEIVKVFDVDTAAKTNRSFAYFLDEHIGQSDHC